MADDKTHGAQRLDVVVVLMCVHIGCTFAIGRATRSMFPTSIHSFWRVHSLQYNNSITLRDAHSPHFIWDVNFSLSLATFPSTCPSGKPTNCTRNIKTNRIGAFSSIQREWRNNYAKLRLLLILNATSDERSDQNRSIRIGHSSVRFAQCLLMRSSSSWTRCQMPPPKVADRGV